MLFQFMNLKKNVGKPTFSGLFINVIIYYKKEGYNIDFMRQSACLIVNLIAVYSYGFLLNCTTVGQT